MAEGRKEVRCDRDICLLDKHVPVTTSYTSPSIAGNCQGIGELVGLNRTVDLLHSGPRHPVCEHLRLSSLTYTVPLHPPLDLTGGSGRQNVEDGKLSVWVSTVSLAKV